MVWALEPSPIGELLLVGDGVALTHVWFDPHGRDARRLRRCQEEGRYAPDDPVLARARTQLDEYFDGTRTAFDVALAPSGTAFQQRVWTALREIPYGTTESYGSVAHRLGLPLTASRAVGTANGSNPIPIIVPCHRVIGADGSLTGFGGGIERKRFLLDLEMGALF